MKINLDRDIDYIDCISDQILTSLEAINNNSEWQEHYIYQMPERAKFKRLRVELTKILMEVENKIYKR